MTFYGGKTLNMEREKVVHQISTIIYNTQLWKDLRRWKQ